MCLNNFDFQNAFSSVPDWQFRQIYYYFLLIHWQLCPLCFNHTHHLLIIHPRTAPLLYRLNAVSFEIEKKIKLNLYCPNSLGYVAFHRSVVGVPGTILLKKTDSLSPPRPQRPEPHCGLSYGWRLLNSFCPPGLAWSCAGSHGCCKFVNTEVSLSTVFLCSSPTSGSYSLCLLPSKTVSEPLRMADVDIPSVADHSTDELYVNGR